MAQASALTSAARAVRFRFGLQSESVAMQTVYRIGAILTVLLGLAACGDSAKKPAMPPSLPIRMACTTPEQAGHKAEDVTKKLAAALSSKRISEDDYRGYNATVGTGMRAWSESHDLKAYCAALEKVVADAALQ